MRGVASKAYRAYVERRQQSRWAFVGAPFGWSPVRPSPRCAHSTYPGTTSRPRLARNTPATTDTSLQVCSTTSCGFALARRRRGARACAIAAGGAFLESGRPCDGHGRGPVGARSGGRAYPPGQGGGGGALATGDHPVEPRLRIAEPRWRCAASRGRRVVQASGGPLDVGDVLAQRHLKPWCRRRRADDLAGLDCCFSDRPTIGFPVYS